MVNPDIIRVDQRLPFLLLRMLILPLRVVLPSGLSLDSARATISGVPVQAESIAFIVRVDDAKGASATLTCIPTNYSPGAR